LQKTASEEKSLYSDGDFIYEEEPV